MNRHSRWRVAALLSILAVAMPAQADVVISQVYGGGGNSGAPLRSDFIELFNTGTQAVALDGWSVQYASSAGTSWQTTALSGSIAPGGYYLVKQADGANLSAPALPDPDATGSIAMASANGKVALVAGTAALSGACPLAETIDFVGFGSANCFEGSGATPALSNTTAALRLEGGCLDSDDNGFDFETGAPAPRNSAAPSNSCLPPPPMVVISQVYGGGGNSGAPLRSDFIELFNFGGEPVSLDGWSVQYASASGTSWQRTNLSGSIAPGGYYLVKQADGANASAPALPDPDAVGTIAMSATNGKVALVAGTGTLSGACPLTETIDFVGFGSANCFEGAAAAPVLSNTTAALRLDGGCIDSDDNAADFETGAPAPRNSAAPTNSCLPPPPMVVISQVYGGGGNSGAPLRSDFIELFNIGTQAVSLDGWSVQYTSASGTSWQRTDLSGSIAPGGYYLVKQADGANLSAPALPDPDATGTIAMASASGKVALVAGPDTLSGACPLAGALDFVGYGSANCFEGAGPTGSLGNTTAALRKLDGCTDTDDNGSDFLVLPPAPRNSASPIKDCSAPPPPVVLTPISAIQGNGNVSPLLGEVRAVEGIVTARKSNGFYLQTPDGQDDGDPSTSEGLFVFTTSGGLPAEAQVGNRVQVQGTVAEFTPTSAPNQLSLSQLTFATTTLIDTGNPLPAPVPLGLAELSPANDPDFLERYEGMRVAIAELTVVGPSLANINESQAISTGNGVFYGTVPSVPRPLREPGVGVLDVVPFPPGVTPPLYDTNPEVLRVDSRGAGGDAVSVDVGATVTGLVGVLDYAFSAYSLLPDPSAAVTVSGGRAPKPARPSAPDEITVASFNLQRFFDDDAGNNSGSSPTLTPEAFQNRLRKTANALCEFLGIPDIVGVVEVEGIDALTALAEAVNGNLPGTCASDPRYVAYLIEGNDVGGIDVGFLVSTAEVAPGLPRVAVNEVVQEGKDALIDNPNGSTSILNDRPPLRLGAIVHGDGSDGFPLTVIVNHLRSLGGVNDPRPGSNGWPTTGDRVRDKRQKQASFLADLVQARQLADPAERIVLVGDFNAFEFSDGYADVMGIVSGLPAPANEVLNHADSPVSPALLNLTLTKPIEERYSFVFDGSAQTLDHILVNRALLDIAAVDVDHARINADFGGDNFGDFGVPVRTSDHDPVVAYIRLPYVSEADLAAVIARPRMPLMFSGQSQDFRLMMRNSGPGQAQRPSLDVLLDAALEDTALTPPPGWDCVGSEVSERQARYQCLLEGLLDARASATFGLRARVVRHRPVQFFTLTTRVAADSDDPNPRNNGASLRLRLVGPTRP